MIIKLNTLTAAWNCRVRLVCEPLTPRTSVWTQCE